jgi:hypothetical protein
MHVLNTKPTASDETVSPQLFLIADSPDFQVPDSTPPAAEASTTSPTEIISVESEPTLSDEIASPQQIADSPDFQVPDSTPPAAEASTTSPTEIISVEGEPTFFALSEHALSPELTGNKELIQISQGSAKNWGTFAKHIGPFKPYISELRSRFAKRGKRLPIDGGPTWAEFVKATWGVSDRYLRMVLNGETATKSKERKKNSNQTRIKDAVNAAREKAKDEAQERRQEELEGELAEKETIIQGLRQLQADLAEPWGDQQEVWNDAIATIVSRVEAVQDTRSAVFYAVTEFAKELRVKRADDQPVITVAVAPPVPQDIELSPEPDHPPIKPRKQLVWTEEFEDVL